MSEFDLLGIAADGMNAQRQMMDIAARNVAAAQASSPGHAYPRLVAAFMPPATRDDDGVDDTSLDDADDVATRAGLRVSGTRAEPGTGDALTEMIAVLDAQRGFEADASIFDVGKRLAERTLDMGRA